MSSVLHCLNASPLSWKKGINIACKRLEKWKMPRNIRKSIMLLKDERGVKKYIIEQMQAKINSNCCKYRV